jgi:hypothetical protein
MITNRTYGIDADVIAYQTRLTAGGVQALNPNALRKLNQFVIGLKKLNVWGLITDIWLTGSEYNSYNPTHNATMYALKSAVNNATVYDTTNGIANQRTTKGLNIGDGSGGGGLRTPNYNIYTPMTIWCIASTDRDPALGSQSTNGLIIAESYVTNGFRAAFINDNPDYFLFWTSESGGNIYLGSTSTTPIRQGQFHSIFFGVNSSRAFLNFDNTKLSSTGSKNMITKTNSTFYFGEGGSGKDKLFGRLPFVLFSQYDLELYYDDLYKLVKSTVGQGLSLL